MNTEFGYIGTHCPRMYRGMPLTSISYSQPEYFVCTSPVSPAGSPKSTSL